MRKYVVFIVLILTSCGLFVPQQVPPALPTAYIDDSSYPTVQAEAAAPVQTFSGINMQVLRAWRDGKEVHADMCFSLPDNSGWSVWSASLQYTGGSIADFGSTLLSIQETAEGQPGLRCDTISFFNVPPDADLSTAIITVDSVAAPPRAEDYCTIYIYKIQQALAERNIGIQLGCVESDGAQIMQIVSRPDTMSPEEAEQIVYSDEFYTIKGPWSFVFNLGQ